MDKAKKDDDKVLEGEVISGGLPDMRPRLEEEPKDFQFSLFALPIIQEARRNCAWGCGIFLVAVALAFILNNPLFVLLGLVLPLWLLSLKSKKKL